jgi:hypothetical protein
MNLIRDAGQGLTPIRSFFDFFTTGQYNPSRHLSGGLMRRTWPCAVLLVLTPSLFAGDSLAPIVKKQPWDWTADERLAARFDPIAVQKRIETLISKREERRSSLSTAAQRSDATPRPMDYLDGRAHPELFFPHEILTMFLRSAYGADDETAQAFRSSAARAASDLGLPNDFMAVFEGQAETLVAMQAKETAIRNALSSGERDDATAMTELRRLESEQCPARFDLIQELRRRYGNTVDRFLYNALASGMSRIVLSAENAHELRHADRGCR